MNDSRQYLDRKAGFRELLTLYGRKPVLEALQQEQLKPVRLHLSSNNRPADILERITEIAQQRGAEVIEHNPRALSRISRNAKQDQGVALDARLPGYQTLDGMLAKLDGACRLIALDGVTNPQNLGMVIRSVAASPCDGLLLCDDSAPAISPLVIKASAGSLFRAPILRSEKLQDALQLLKESGFVSSSLEPGAGENLLTAEPAGSRREVFILGGESSGVSEPVRNQVDRHYHLPMARGVESLNVAVTAALVAFLSNSPRH